MQVDINVAFHLVLVPYFTYVFPVRVTTAQYEKYFAKESGLDI